MDKSATWARTNLPEAARLSDTELQAISSATWRVYRKAQAVVLGVAFFLYLVYLDDHISRAIFDDTSFTHRLAIAMIFGAVLGGLLGWLFQALVRRRIRNVVRSD